MVNILFVWKYENIFKYSLLYDFSLKKCGIAKEIKVVIRPMTMGTIIDIINCLLLFKISFYGNNKQKLQPPNPIVYIIIHYNV